MYFLFILLCLRGARDFIKGSNGRCQKENWMMARKNSVNFGFTQIYSLYKYKVGLSYKSVARLLSPRRFDFARCFALSRIFEPIARFIMIVVETNLIARFLISGCPFSQDFN